eukprot:352965-Chlamydomonas_euryale.AAC.26
MNARRCCRSYANREHRTPCKHRGEAMKLPRCGLILDGKAEGCPGRPFQVLRKMRAAAPLLL